MGLATLATAVALLGCHDLPDFDLTDAATEYQAVSSVPASPPDSITQAMWDEITRPANLIARGRGRIVRDVLSIQFFPSATLAERQRAIALANGVVIGGSRVGYPEHAYLVRIPYALSAGDGLLDPLLRAIGVLRVQPTIEFATFAILNMISSNLEPRAGAGFTASDTVRHGAIVPVSPPDSITQAMWDEITEPANLIARGPGRFIRDVISIQFFPSATLAARQYAIGLVSGVVIGGSGGGFPEHDYYVRIPYVLRASDGPLDPLLRAITVLKALPTIEFARWESQTTQIAPYNLKPRDGAGVRSKPVSGDSARVTLIPPDTTPGALFKALGSVSGRPLTNGPYLRDIVLVEFVPGTPLADRQDAIDSIGGIVVGGKLDSDKQDGANYVQISGGRPQRWYVPCRPCSGCLR